MGKVLQNACGGRVGESVTRSVWVKSEGEYSSIIFECLKEMVSGRMMMIWFGRLRESAEGLMAADGDDDRRQALEAATGSSLVGIWRYPAASRAGPRLRLADERKGQQLQKGVQRSG